ncbi:hypothetical protein OGAPHI_005275 [Ogataea philodendri]|uniref:Uncharacterized protein n=1 Tax=Ogataea philodendri TaxID=1378263 RepID=A0A9P8P278_9ASCO|nr:uncharacterized protein OGAPHI_005275 [Ogataea philodendri]KAH3663872.1 hypothetical protein OGAPHI_005275 [Ogataea philodendri]
MIPVTKYGSMLEAGLLSSNGLVLTGQSEVVVVTVQSNVLGVSLGQFLDGGLDGLHTAWNSHRGSRNVGMASSTVPVSLERLWMEGDLDTKLLSDLVEQVSGHPQLVTHLDTFARSNLELPLGRHHLGVDTGNSDTGMQAGSVVGLDNVSGKHLTGTNTTVVWSLWGWETSLWPSVDRAINRVQQSVFLFQTKPDFFGGVGGHELVALMSVVELVWSSVVVPALSQDNNVVALSEWVWVESDRSEVDIGVVAWGLAGGRTVKVPLWQLGHISDFLGQGSSLGSHIARTVNPDVLGNHLAVLVQVHILGQGGCVF